MPATPDDYRVRGLDSAHVGGNTGGMFYRFASHPRLYDAVQFLAGRPLITHRLRHWLAHERGLVVDIGGGTGSVRALLAPGTRHLCVDLDPLKLAEYRAKFPGELALTSDAVDLPLRERSVPTVTLIAVSHHLDDERLDRALSEIARVLTPDGSFYFFDAVAVPGRAASEFLWSHDRGAYPRTASTVMTMLDRRFRVFEPFEFSVWHRYLGCRCEAR